MATYINNNVKFHAFSKSPVSPDTTLGGAVNPSGHTITTSQVRAQDIPAFLNTFQGTKEQAITWLATNYATPAHNDIVYYGGEFKAGFSTPKCLKYNAKAETPSWEDFDITTASTLKNADDKDVIAVHQNCTTVFVDGGNNAATNSNRWSLFVKKADGSILDHFVASTDKIVAGMPSLGYNALVLWNNAAIDEGELDANYVGNTFAGIVHLNKQYAAGDDAKFKVTCFEYIGEKLDTSISSLHQSIKDISDVTLKGVVASVTADENTAQKAGITVDNTVSTTPVIKFTAGSVTAGETKLVSGGAVAAVTDALAGRIAALEGVKLSVQVVDTLPTTPVVNTLYLVPEQGSTTGTYVEYIAYKPEGSETVTTERIGTTAVDLEGYTTDAEHKALADRVEALDKADGKIATIESQIATITSTDATKDGSIAKALADAKSYVDTTALTPATGSIAKYVENYVATNAKVSVNGQSATTITVKGTEASAADLVKVVVTEDKTTSDKIGLTLTATADVATVTDGVADSDGKLVTAGGAKDIAEKAISTAITEADGAIKDAIDSTISDATLTSSDDAIQSATGDDARKLVTAEQVKEYVDENAKVTLTADTATGKTGIVIDKNGQESTSFTIGIDQEVIATKKSVDDLSSLVSALPATIEAAQDAADAAMAEAQAKVASVTTGTVPDGVTITTGTTPQLSIVTAQNVASVDGNKLVTKQVAESIASGYATSAANAAQSAVEGKSLTSLASSTQGDYVSVTTSGTVGTGLTVNVDDSALASTVSAAASAIQTVKVNGTALTATSNAVDITAIVGVDETVANGIKVTKTTDNKVKVSVEPATYESSSKSWSGTAYFAKASDVATAISDAVGAIVIPKLGLNPGTAEYGFYLSSDEGSGAISNHYLGLATASYTPASGDTAASWTNKGYLVTGSTVETFVGAETAKALEEAKAYSDSLHTTSLDYVVLGDSESLPTASADTLGKIYLVASQNAPTADGAAISGSYVEYMTRKVSETEYTWEKIGTTAADLSGYAKSVKINGQTYNVTANTVDLGSIVTSIANPTAVGGNGLTVETRGDAYPGEYYVSIAAATPTQMGTSKMFTGSIDATGTATDTAVSVKSASGLYTILAAAIGSKVDNVQAGEGDVLTGLSVSVGGTDTAPTISVTNGVINSGSLPATAKVVANGLIDGTDVIETEKIAFVESDDVAKIQAFVPADAQLTTWVGDMPNLESGYEMFASCATLTTFIGDLSSLKHGNQMFNGCGLTTFIGDLSSLVHGDNMFTGCELDAESVEAILDTIPEVTADGSSKLTLGCSAKGFATASDITSTSTNGGGQFTTTFKGWYLTVINTNWHGGGSN